MTEAPVPNLDTPAEDQEQDEFEILMAQLLELIACQDSEGLEVFFDNLTVSASLRMVMWLPPEKRDRLLEFMPNEIAAELISQMPNEQAVEFVERLDADVAVSIINEMDSDVQADVLGELDEERADAIFAEMDEEDAEEVRLLASYDDDLAGGLMTTDVFSFRVDETVGLILRTMSTDDEDFDRYRGQHPYVVDEDGRLVGVISLRTMLAEKRSTKLANVLSPAISVTVETHIDDLEDIFVKEEFLCLPVCDAEGRLVGVVSRTAVQEAFYQKAEADNMKRHGVVGDELRSMPLWFRSRRRLWWLSVNILLNVAAASVISAYEETLAAVIAIAVFLPMVSDMSGCSGNQAVAVSLRELALGFIKPIDMMRVWLKEVSVGVINGVVLGVLVAVVAWIWKGNGYLGLVIGIALMLNTVIAVSIGGIVPLVLKRFNQDPAVASGPLLTTITDMAGFFLVLSLASVFMPLL